MTGRYDALPVLAFHAAGGVVVSWKMPPVLPPGESVASGDTVTVRAEEVDRLDLLANRALGNPGLAWRIAEANDAMDPFELCQEGATLLLPEQGP